MTKNLFLTVYFLVYLKVFSQDSLRILHIDSSIIKNESKVSTIFQKFEKNRIETLHGRNPEKISTVYRFANNNILLSTTFVSYSIGDTDLIVNLYFDSGNLIKAKTVSFGIDGNRCEYNYYYISNQLINKEVENIGVHRADYYLERAARLRRELKKRPIKFPL